MATPTPIPASAPVVSPPPEFGDVVPDPVLVAGEEICGDGLVFVVLVEEDALVVDARCSKGADLGVNKLRSIDSCAIKSTMVSMALRPTNKRCIRGEPTQTTLKLYAAAMNGVVTFTIVKASTATGVAVVIVC